MSKSTIKIFSLRSYTFFLLATSLLGVHIISINIGSFQLSPYRILLLLSPFILLKVDRRATKRLRKSLNYEYFAFMLFWIIYSILPLLWINDFSGWAKVYIFLISGFITTWFIGLYLISIEDIIKAMKTVEFITLLFGGIAIYEIITGHYMFISESNLEFYKTQSLIRSTLGLRVPISVFSNPNNFTMFLLFSICTSFGLSKVKNSRSGRTYSFFLFMFFVFLLISTQSRGGFIGLLLGVLTYILIKFIKTNTKHKLKLLVAGIIFAPILIFFISQNSDLYQALITVDTANIGSDITRLNLIKNGFHFLVNSFFLGVGLGNIEYLMANYAIFPIGDITNIHNWWMEILVSSGIIVFIFYIIIYIKNLRRLFRFSFYKQEKDLHILSAVFFSYLVAFFITSTASSSLMNSEWFWPQFAIIMAFVNLLKNKKIQN